MHDEWLCENANLASDAIISFQRSFKKLSFITSNERHNDSIAYLLKRPPKA